MKTLVIINPTSARARDAWPRIESSLKENTIDFDLHPTSRAGDATERTRAALGEGYQVIAVVGGDGTLSEVASGFFVFDGSSFPSPINPNAALAILPAGTGDDFARGLRGSREPVEKWLETLVAFCRHRDPPATRLIDVIKGRVANGNGDFIFLNVATIGLGAEVAARVAAQGNVLKRLPGEARFVTAAFGALTAWRERRVRIVLDEGAVIELSTNLIAVANGIYAGGGMMFAPDARHDDGLIDLVLTNDLTRTAILCELPRIRRGEHLTNTHVRVIRTSRLTIETLSDGLLVEADGNVRGHTPAEFRIVPKAVRVVVPNFEF